MQRSTSTLTDKLPVVGTEPESPRAAVDDNDIELRLLLKESYWERLRECLQTILREVDARVEHHRHLTETFVEQRMEEQQNKLRMVLTQGVADKNRVSFGPALGRVSTNSMLVAESRESSTKKYFNEDLEQQNLNFPEEEAIQPSFRLGRPSLTRERTLEFHCDEKNRWQSLKEQVQSRRLNKSDSFLDGVRQKFRSFSNNQKPPNTLMVRIATSTAFAAATSFLILLNVVFIGYQSEVSVERAFASPDRNDPDLFKTVNRIFAYAFMAEVIVRIIAMRWFFIVGPDWQWNIFDLALVTSSVVEELLNILNLSFFRALRVLRMVRALRLIRVVRFFGELRTMVCSVLYTLSSLAWALIFLLLIMYLFSIVFMQATASYVKDAEAGDPMVGDFKKWYSTLGSTMYSLFLAISGGMDWYELQRPLQKVSVIYSLMFAAYIFFVVFGVLNVLIGVFVERASEASKLDRDLMVQAEQRKMDNLIQEMRDLFDDMPKDNLGSVTKRAFNEYIQDDDVKAYLKTRQLEVAAQRLFQVLEASGENSEALDCDEFVSGMMRLEGGAKNADILMLLSDSVRIHRKLSHMANALETQCYNLPCSRTSSSRNYGVSDNTNFLVDMPPLEEHIPISAMEDSDEAKLKDSL